MPNARIPGKKDIPSVGQLAILHYGKILECGNQVIFVAKCMVRPFMNLLDRPVDLIYKKILLKISRREPAFPPLRFHLATKDHVLNGTDVCFPCFIGFPNKDFIPVGIRDVSARGNFNNSNKVTVDLLDIDRYQGFRRKLSFQL
jgi:hypothetical protein